jgi:hypothetical protein
LDSAERLYFSVHHDDDSGSIIHFKQRHPEIVRVADEIKKLQDPASAELNRLDNLDRTNT